MRLEENRGKDKLSVVHVLPLYDGATEDGSENLVRTMAADGKYPVRTGCSNCDKLIPRKEPDVYSM